MEGYKKDAFNGREKIQLDYFSMYWQKLQISTDKCWDWISDQYLEN